MPRMIAVLFILSLIAVACTTAAPTSPTADTPSAEVGPRATVTSAETATAGTTAGTATANSAPEVGLRIGDIAPDFETTRADGTAVALSDYRGQVVLLNFWATWCGPCRIEMPAFQAQYEAHQDDGFVILAVNNQETVEDVLDFQTGFELTFPLLMDENGRINERYALFSYPSTFILDRDGVILARHFGPLTEDQITALISEQLGPDT